MRRQDRQSVGESLGSCRRSTAAIRWTRKDLAPSRDSAIPRICKHAIKRPNSSRDRPRSVEPDYSASIAVLMCKPIEEASPHCHTLSYHAQFARYHATYSANPSAKGVFGLYPDRRMHDQSRHRSGAHRPVARATAGSVGSSQGRSNRLDRSPQLDGIGISKIVTMMPRTSLNGSDHSIDDVGDERIISGLCRRRTWARAQRRSISRMNLAIARSGRFLGPYAVKNAGRSPAVRAGDER